ncbi:LOW QUALITY PROTEIN: hypothetical protein AAY473_024313 [Plecturocebus cupreus]
MRASWPPHSLPRAEPGELVAPAAPPPLLAGAKAADSKDSLEEQLVVLGLALAQFDLQLGALAGRVVERASRVGQLCLSALRPVSSRPRTSSRSVTCSCSALFSVSRLRTLSMYTASRSLSSRSSSFSWSRDSRVGLSGVVGPPARLPVRGGTGVAVAMAGGGERGGEAAGGSVTRRGRQGAKREPKAQTGDLRSRPDAGVWRNRAPGVAGARLQHKGQRPGGNYESTDRSRNALCKKTSTHTHTHAGRCKATVTGGQTGSAPPQSPARSTLFPLRLH